MAGQPGHRADHQGLERQGDSDCGHGMRQDPVAPAPSFRAGQGRYPADDQGDRLQGDP